MGHAGGAAGGQRRNFVSGYGAKGGPWPYPPGVCYCPPYLA